MKWASWAADVLCKYARRRRCVCVCVVRVWYKMSEMEKENGDLRRQLDRQVYTSKPGLDRDDLDKLSHAELARRYSKLR